MPPIKAKQNWGQLYGSSLSLALASICKTQAGVKFIIAPDNLTAYQLQDDIRFFLNQEALLFPDWETLPYDQFSPHQDIISERLATLNSLINSMETIIISPIQTLMHRLCPPDFLKQYLLILKEKDILDQNIFRNQLNDAGYRLVHQVLEHGEFAIRGSIIDVFPMGSKDPFRIELFDNYVDSIRIFDSENQKTIRKTNNINVIPAHEFPLNTNGIAQFRKSFREHFPGNPAISQIYTAISDKQSPPGVEYYLPLFFAKTATIFDYLPPQATVILINDIHANAEKFWHEVTLRYQAQQCDITRPLLPPQQIFLTPAEFLTAVNDSPTKIQLNHKRIDKKGMVFNFSTQSTPDLSTDHNSDAPLLKLQHYLAVNSRKYLFVVESAGRREALLDLLRRNKIDCLYQKSWDSFLATTVPVNIAIGPLITGAEICDKQNIVIIVEAQLFGEQPLVTRAKQQKIIDPNFIIRSLSELNIGSPIVHIQFGVGRYQGLQTLIHNNIVNEFLVLSYAGNDKIYVPVTSLHLISRYSGSDTEHAPLHQLGTDRWQREKKKTVEKIHDIAIELLELYAKRKAISGFGYKFDPQQYLLFANNFQFTETPDQLAAIKDIINDMQSSEPMDRLICGDVGFGKTEVAMRAAFIAVQNNKQVCILVPTTLLATQHFENFRDRFADFAVNIELLSRFKRPKECALILESVEQGRIDIIIGTHKLLSKDVKFKNLGLLIIDEEHRFGVKQKAHIQQLRTHVDLLSLTATPIPRTLNIAMAGIRNISLIATPPAKRLTIKTFWQEKNTYLLREAILREILRGGQVYYLHNDTKTITKIAQDLQHLIPEAKIVYAHGKMHERELEKIMADFHHHHFNVLVCTTIIESGIDIPTANTIIIDRADKFGLAQLHQLRGRVGRSHHQAYAYLFTPNKKQLTKDAVKRLEAIISLEDLGAGFILATHDLEIRGAGELLGEEQSGNINAVGFSLFMEMLDKSIADLKSGKTMELAAPIHVGPEIDLQISAILPEDYIYDVHIRLITYKRIANAVNETQLHDLQIELIDRFGLLPTPAKHLIAITLLKLLAQRSGVLKIRASTQFARLEFGNSELINLQILMNLIQTQSNLYQMDGMTAIRCTLKSQNPEGRILEIEQFLRKITS